MLKAFLSLLLLVPLIGIWFWACCGLGECTRSLLSLGQLLLTLTEPLNVHPIWVGLIDLSLHFWEHSCYEAIINSIGRFLKVNEATSSMDHTTFARILVDIDISSPLSGDVVLMVGDRPWSQLLDFEGLPFCCRRCVSTGHLSSNCSISQHKGVSPWWKNATVDHLTINALDFAPAGSSHEDDVDVVPLMTTDAPVAPFVASFPEVPAPASPVLQPHFSVSTLR